MKFYYLSEGGGDMVNFKIMNKKGKKKKVAV